MHVQAVLALQEKIGITESSLQCGTHMPGDVDELKSLIVRNQPPRTNHNNCSGKHTAMLAHALMRGLTLENYLDGYSVAGARLAGLQVPVSILTSADDPVIPVDDFARLQLPASASLEIAPWGGHCGFLEGASLEGFAERWVADRLAAAADAEQG